MDWREYIHSNPEILLGKPIVKGTRLSVEFILDLFSAGWSEGKILENYPTLTEKSLQAVFAFATECMREESLFALPTETP
ncbi:DUF433 domain-containing protein [candidate division WOR-3 bacterium]|nr:DUF433 domain-containing protein [candidate division WOR-3 bacterium]MCK4528718.1 DUF433 domain-containing protein [candidate division WOR-3 bacterium]